MNEGSSWDSARWRDGGQHQPFDRSRPPPLSAPTAVNPASQSAILDRYSHDAHRWDARSLTERRMSEHHTSTESYTDGSTYPSRPHERHTPAPGGNYGPQHQLTSASPHPPPTGAWRSLHRDDRRPSTTQLTTDAPLTLHIPQGQDLPRIAPSYPHVKTEGQPYPRPIPTPSQPAPSLPSFATFQEHANRSDDPDVDGPEIAPMASRLSCYSCTKLTPLVREVAVAVAELDENIQSHCNKTVTKRLDIPSDSPLRILEWVLDRVRYAKRDMQDAARRSYQPAYFFPHPPAPSGGLTSRPASPQATLKRQAAWDDYPTTKRSKSGDSPPDSLRRIATVPAYHGDRRASIDFLPRTVYSPQAADSAPQSAYPQGGSPGAAGRPLRPLPSPSSMVYPPSAAPSLPPPTLHPGSPAPSYPASVSIHTTSTNSATSAHIADLQHQVTLKSLAHQTLQSEYSGLLQKLQREKVKSQTIEKKTTVSEQEVNDLTGRNEELADQVKSLEAQVEESERKRENERLDYAKEKDQWGRMLDMSGRLQSKLSIERQTLTEERDDLRRRIAALESQRGGQSSHAADGGEKVNHQEDNAVTRLPTESSSSGDVSDLKREIVTLKAKVDDLVHALQQARRHNNDLRETSKSLVENSGEIDAVVVKALGDEGGGISKAQAAEQASTQGIATVNVLPAPQMPVPSNGTPPVVISTPRSPPKLAPLTSSYINNGKSPLPTPTSATVPSVAEMASAGRAVSPGAEELGIHVQPSTSSPEELIKALGPVPAPLPPFRFAAGAPFGGPSGRDTSAASSSTQRNNRSPPGVQSGNFSNHATSSTEGRTYFHSSPYGQVPSPYIGQHRLYRTNRTSPPSSHSSPNSTRDDSPTNSSGSAKGRSPERTGREDHRTPSGPANQFPRFPEMPATAGPGLPGFRQWSHDSKAAMPPPPRPFSGPQTVGFGQNSGS